MPGASRGAGQELGVSQVPRRERQGEEGELGMAHSPSVTRIPDLVSGPRSASKPLCNPFGGSVLLLKYENIRLHHCFFKLPVVTR